MDPQTTPRRYNAMMIVTLILFVGVHLGSLLCFWTGFTWRDIVLCVGLYALRMFGITAGYHRYFAHRAYKTSRWFQFVLAWLGAMSIQKGPLWWAGWHRVHHRWSDTPKDLHSPKQRGFWYSHMGWFVSPEHDATELAQIPDFAKFPELRWLNVYHWVPATVMAVACGYWGGFRAVVWGAGVSTVLLWHGTFTINSLAHVWGSRRYETNDTSRNNWFLALITLGEGWHNNHHHYMNSAQQGFYWWEIDVSYYVLRALSWVGIVRDLRTPPAHVLRPKLSELATARIAEARHVAEQKFAEAYGVAEARLAGAREAAGHTIAEARQAAGDARIAAENTLAEACDAVESAVENTATSIGR
jgi:stearoyl-CoA desaturase (Delta-9 desaturase)